MKSLELGWRNFVDSWEFESNWNCLTLSGQGYFGFMRNLDDFSNPDCTFEYKDYCGALSRSCARATFAGHETHGILQTHSSWLNSMCKLELGIG